MGNAIIFLHKGTFGMYLKCGLKTMSIKDKTLNAFSFL